MSERIARDLHRPAGAADRGWPPVTGGQRFAVRKPMPGADMRTFLVECYWPGIESDSGMSTERVSRVTAAWEGSQRSVKWLGCILLPSDGLALFLFQAMNELDVKAFGRRAEMPFDRVVEAIRVDRESRQEGSAWRT